MARRQGYGYWLLVVAGVGHLLRLRRQECPVPAARLVARRDGRPDARLGAGPLGHDGRGRRVSGRPVLSGLRAGSAAGDRRHRLHHAVHGRDDRHHGHRHQARAGLFDGQPARLHDAGPGRRRLAGRHVAPDHARLLQEPVVPLLRLGDSRRAHQRNDRRWAGCGRRCRSPPTRCSSAAWRSPGPAIPFADRLERLLLEGRDPGAGLFVLAVRTRRSGAACSSWRPPAARRSRRSTCSACGS